MSRIVLVLASSSHPDEEQSHKDRIETAPFCSEAKFASLLLKTAQVTQQNGWKIYAEIGFSKNFAQTENKPEIAQTKLYSLVVGGHWNHKRTGSKNLGGLP